MIKNLIVAGSTMSERFEDPASEEVPEEVKTKFS
jgi:hypothetical protein